jgi:oligopeptide/dipeptide ABC transporter ATP-binding protein
VTVLPPQTQAVNGSDVPLLSVADLRTWFITPRGTIRAVDGVELELAKGQTLGIVGESGSGKTVLSRSIMGLLPRRGIVRSGSVRFEGRDLMALSERELREVWGTGMSMVFQDPMTSLNPVLRIGHQLTEGLRVRLGMTKADANAEAVRLLRTVGIPEPEQRLRQYPHNLSGGMRQRVVIAIALACNPKLLLADEPTTALDVTIQSQILDLLGDKQQERRMAMILVTHDLGIVAGRTDLTAVMYAGRVVEIAPTATLFRHTRMPYTEALMKSIPKLDAPAHTRLNAIGGRPPALLDPAAACPFAPRCPYARPRCSAEAPPLVPATEPKHLYACWYPLPDESEAV